MSLNGTIVHLAHVALGCKMCRASWRVHFDLVMVFFAVYIESKISTVFLFIYFFIIIVIYLFCGLKYNLSDMQTCNRIVYESAKK